MQAVLNPRIKICCIKNIDEAQLAIEMGADALGLVGKMPSGPGVISDTQIRKIAAFVPPPIATFLLTSETSADNIIAHHNKVNTTAIQFVDTLQEGSYAQIRKALPGVKLVQVIHVNGSEAIGRAQKCSAYVDAILLDSGNPQASIKELGGTGRKHNWQISCKIRAQINTPLFLAGGLNPVNVQYAISEVHPFGLDICSGVRSEGNLDPVKLQTFFENIRKHSYAK